MDISSLFSISNVLFEVPLPGNAGSVHAVSFVELWATILGLASVIGARLNKAWWYPVGILNSIGFIAIFYQVQLYSDLLVNVYFIAISLAGWWMWLRKTAGGDDRYEIRYLNVYNQIYWVSVIIIGTVFLGTFINEIFSFLATGVATIMGTEYTHIPAANPYWDASTTVMSIVAMYFLARRLVEAWILWIIVDIIAVFLYAYRGVIVLSVEYFVFLLNAIYALYQWNKVAK